MNAFLPLALLLLTACHWGYRPHPQEGQYLTGEPEGSWQPVEPGSADRAWFNAQDGAAMYTDSNCGRRYSDDSLERMLSHLTSGIAEGEPLSETRLQLADRAALVRTWQARLDGVPIQVGAMVLKRNNCIYDALIIAPESAFEQNWSDFQRVINGFEVEGN